MSAFANFFSERDSRGEKITWQIHADERTRYLPKIFWQSHCVRWGLIFSAFSLILFVLFNASIIVFGDSAELTRFFWWAMIASATLAMVIIFGTLFTGHFRTHLFNYFLSRSQCPACLTSLRGQPLEDDDCVVCPECGAAWKITDRVAQP